MSIFLTVLKVIGIILLVILLLVLLILSLVLFVPFTYGVKGSFHEKEPEGEARFSWLFRGVSVKLEYRDKKLDIYAKILGLIKINILDKIRNGKKEPQEETPLIEAVPPGGDVPPAAQPDSEKPAVTAAAEAPAVSPEPPETADTETAPVKPQEAPEAAEENAAAPDTEAPEAEENENASEAPAEEAEGNGIREKAARLIQKLKDLYTEKKAKLDETLADLEDKKEFLLRDRVKAAVAHVLKMVFKMLRHIMPKKLSGNAELGLSSPAATGRVLAILSATMPLHKNRFRIRPDFENERIEADGKFTGRIFVIVLLVYAVRIILNRNVLYVLKNFKKHFS